MIGTPIKFETPIQGKILYIYIYAVHIAKPQGRSWGNKNICAYLRLSNVIRKLPLGHGWCLWFFKRLLQRFCQGQHIIFTFFAWGARSLKLDPLFHLQRSIVKQLVAPALRCDLAACWAWNCRATQLRQGVGRVQVALIIITVAVKIIHIILMLRRKVLR